MINHMIDHVIDHMINHMIFFNRVNTGNIANIARYQAKVEVKVLSSQECTESIVRAGDQYFLPPSEFCTKPSLSFSVYYINKSLFRHF